MMLTIAVIAVAAYFALWVYTYSLVVRVQNAFYRRFPKEAEQSLGSMKSFGVNKKTGLLFLWQKSVRELLKNDQSIERLRQHAVRCIVFLLAVIVLMPVFLIFIVWGATSM